MSSFLCLRKVWFRSKVEQLLVVTLGIKMHSVLKFTFPLVAQNTAMGGQKCAYLKWESQGVTKLSFFLSISWMQVTFTMYNCVIQPSRRDFFGKRVLHRIVENYLKMCGLINCNFTRSSFPHVKPFTGSLQKAKYYKKWCSGHIHLLLRNFVHVQN